MHAYQTRIIVRVIRDRLMSLCHPALSLSLLQLAAAVLCCLSDPEPEIVAEASATSTELQVRWMMGIGKVTSTELQVRWVMGIGK